MHLLEIQEWHVIWFTETNGFHRETIKLKMKIEKKHWHVERCSVERLTSQSYTLVIKYQFIVDKYKIVFRSTFNVSSYKVCIKKFYWSTFNVSSYKVCIIKFYWSTFNVAVIKSPAYDTLHITTFHYHLKPFKPEWQRCLFNFLNNYRN